MTANIFISYASQDLKVASTLCKALEGRGFKCWISSRDVLPGENFQVAIVRAIRGAKMMLLVFTGNSNNSEEMTKELVLASQNRLIVVPLRIEDVTPNEAFAYEFATRQWIDFFADWEAAIDQLSMRIAGAIGASPELEAPAAAPAVRAPEPLAPPPEPPRPEPPAPTPPVARAPEPVAAPVGVPAAPAAADVVTAAAKPAPTSASVPSLDVKPPPEPAKVEAKLEAKPAAAAAAATAPVAASVTTKPAPQPAPVKAAAAPPSAKVDAKPPPAKPATTAAVEGEPRKGPPIALFVGLGVVIALIIAAVVVLPNFLHPPTPAPAQPVAVIAKPALPAVAPPVVVTPAPAANTVIAPSAATPPATNSTATNAITAPAHLRKHAAAGPAVHQRSSESTEVPF